MYVGRDAQQIKENTEIKREGDRQYTDRHTDIATQSATQAGQDRQANEQTQGRERASGEELAQYGTELVLVPTFCDILTESTKRLSRP